MKNCFNRSYEWIRFIVLQAAKRVISRPLILLATQNYCFVCVLLVLLYLFHLFALVSFSRSPLCSNVYFYKSTACKTTLYFSFYLRTG